VRRVGKVEPRYGDRKTVTKFALFPIRAGNELRWLEYVTVEVEYRISEWTPIRFLDAEREDKFHDKYRMEDAVWKMT
jgi:hypothetical protein